MEPPIITNLIITSSEYVMIDPRINLRPRPSKFCNNNGYVNLRNWSRAALNIIKYDLLNFKFKIYKLIYTARLALLKLLLINKNI